MRIAEIYATRVDWMMSGDDSEESFRERIKEAAQYVPLSRLSLSPQCGFASTEIGNKLTEEDQWKKIALVRDIAQTVWG